MIFMHSFRVIAFTALASLTMPNVAVAEIGTLITGSKECRMSGGRMISCQTDADCNYTSGICTYNGARELKQRVTIDKAKDKLMLPSKNEVLKKVEDKASR
jgi:hypothetical protein